MNTLQLLKTDIASAPIVQEILRSAKTFHRNTQGEALKVNAGESVFLALPPNCEMAQKHVLLIQADTEIIGVIDLIEGYPNPHVAYIGLLLLKQEKQVKGYGRQAYLQLEEYILKLSSIKKIRLSYVETNPVREFWEKMGFTLTGESKPYESGEIKSRAIVMEKSFQSFFSGVKLS